MSKKIDLKSNSHSELLCSPERVSGSHAVEMLKQVQHDNSRKGFTLAEVLITLGIIGVVAAMTIPTLIANTNSSKFASQFKKSLSTLNQAALMATAQNDVDYGSINAKDKNDGSTCASDHKLSDGDATICALFNTTLAGATYNDATALGKLTSNGKKYSVARNFNLSGTHASAHSALAFTNYVGYQMADGSLVVVNKSLGDCTIDGQWDGTFAETAGKLSTKCLGYIDVNGATLPNKEVICDTASETNFSTEVCTVPKDTSHMTDIYPVVFHDQTVEPATNAARAVLTGATKNSTT